MSINLTKLQQTAKDKIVDWINNYKTTKKQIFVLAGYAGTGKTFLVNYIIDNILKFDSNEVAFVAPTGKAANVLIQRGAKDATTIHKLIYTRVEKEVTAEINGKTVTTKKIEFVRRANLELSYLKLIVMDETSMVEKKILDDILKYGIPILCCGDPFQLPPVTGTSNGLLENPDVTLTEIVRQSEENAIIKLATKIRNGGKLDIGNYGDVIVLSSKMLSPERRAHLLTKADQVICGTNRTRRNLNNEIKGYLNLEIGKLNEGEKVICLLNNWSKSVNNLDEYYLVNGMMGTVSEIKMLEGCKDKLGTFKFTPDFIDASMKNIVFDNGYFLKSQPFYEFHDNVCLMGDGTYEIKKHIDKNSVQKDLIDYFKQKLATLSVEQINFFDSAYAISCHKAQGAEWDNVVVFDESYVFGKDWDRWLYTAITRAKKRLLIII